MRLLFLAILFLPLTVLSQTIVDFDMDINSGYIGGYAQVTYTITNVSNNAVSLTEIQHSDATQTVVIPGTTTLNPGDTVVETNRIAIAGHGSTGFFGFSSQAEVFFVSNGVTSSELSDGIDLWGTRNEDGLSFYFGSTGDTYGIIYLDNNLNSRFDNGIDTPLPGVDIIKGAGGITGIITTNEAGFYSTATIQSSMPVSDEAVIDMNSFPPTTGQYIQVQGTNPTYLNTILSIVSRQDFGFIVGNFGVLKSNVYLDLNNNGTRDSNEPSIPNAEITFTENNDPSTAITLNNGSGRDVYKVDFDAGNQLNDISASLGNNSAYFNITTPDYDDVITQQNDTLNVPFAATEISASNRDVGIELVSIRPHNPGFDSDLRINLRNHLNGNPQGVLQFNVDSNSSVSEVRDTNGNDLVVNGSATVSGTGFTYNYSLNDFENAQLIVKLSTPTSAQIGDLFTHSAQITPSGPDIISGNNTDSIIVVTEASYDPNDVFEARGPRIPINTFSTSDYLEYTIRFQNLGTAAAQFVRIEQDLHEQMLDINSIEMISSSHPYTSIQTGKRMRWYFDDIQLPPEVTDAEGSNGFVKYRIKPLPGFSVGDIIIAEAGIYFDYNAVVRTPQWRTTFDAPNSINSVDSQITIYPNPVTGNQIHTSLQEGDFYIFNLQGSLIQNGSVNGGEIILSDQLKQGLYLLKIESGNGSETIKLLKQ